MKTKIVGLAAITLALVMSMGVVSADYIVSTTIDVESGYAVQGIEHTIPYGDIFNGVAIGNFGVTAGCVPPWDIPVDILDAAMAGLVYDETVKGTGSVATSLGLVTIPDSQKCTKFFQQSAKGHKVAVAEMGNVGPNYQDLLFATDGFLEEYKENKAVTVRECTDEVVQVAIDQSVSMSSTDPTIEKAMLFHDLDAPALNDLDIDQYLAAPDIDWDFTLLYDIPT